MFKVETRKVSSVSPKDGSITYLSRDWGPVISLFQVFDIINEEMLNDRADGAIITKVEKE